MLKLMVYILSSILVIWSMDAVNINSIFKKNKVVQARVFYIILALVIIYLFANLLYDFVNIKIFN